MGVDAAERRRARRRRHVRARSSRLRQLGEPDRDDGRGRGGRRRAGCSDVQNRDGGIPTFCRGWGTLPFDRSTPEITAHALQAWSALAPALRPGAAAQRLRRAPSGRRVPRREPATPTAAWIPLWFGNEHAPDEDNPVYGTARVLLGLQSRAGARRSAARRAVGVARSRGCSRAQNADGGWGGDRGVRVVDRGNRRRAGSARSVAAGRRRAPDARGGVQRGAAG